jgi:hypothetical protein
MFKDYKDCSHEKLIFGSGDFLLFCMECSTNWVQHPWPREDGQWGKNLSGEHRVKFPDNLTYLEVKAQEKGLI